MSQVVGEQRATLCRELGGLLGEGRLVGDPAKLDPYRLPTFEPVCAAFPSSTEEVGEVMRYAAKRKVAVLPWGGGTNQGVGAPVQGAGIVLCLGSMDRVVELDAGNLSAIVEAGITNLELQRQLSEHNLFFALDPPRAERSTVGGELAANSSGPKRLFYGTARDMALGMTIVTAAGEVLRFGGKTMKNVAGYDLTKLFVGSWGTLGVITQAALRLQPLPENPHSLLTVFPSASEAMGLVSEILASQFRPLSLELMDAIAGKALTEGYDVGLSGDEWLLLVTITGSIQGVRRQEEWLKEAAAASRARDFTPDMGQVCANRRDLNYSLRSKAAATVWGKASVPITALGEALDGIKAVASELGLDVALAAHAGNGVLFPYLMLHGSDSPFRAVDGTRRIRELVASLGGFFLLQGAPREIWGQVAALPPRGDYTLMRGLKASLDPDNLLSPGKLLFETLC